MWRECGTVKCGVRWRRVLLWRECGSVECGVRWREAVVVERVTRNKMQAIMDNVCHPLHTTMADQKSGRKNLFISITCKTKRYKNTFIPTAIRLFNSTASRQAHELWTIRTTVVFSSLIIYGSICNTR